MQIVSNSSYFFHNFHSDYGCLIMCMFNLSTWPVELPPRSVKPDHRFVEAENIYRSVANLFRIPLPEFITTAYIFWFILCFTRRHLVNNNVLKRLNFTVLPREAMRKCGLCCRLLVSVRPSVTLVDYIHMAEDIVILLVWSDNPITLVFCPHARLLHNSKGNPFSGGAKYTGWEKLAIFD